MASETPNWLEMPDEIMGGMIFPRLGTLEILKNVEKVCTTWQKICKDDPRVWKVIDLDNSSSAWYTENDFEELCKQAVDRSHGELIHIILKHFCTDDLLYYISRCSSKLNRLCLTYCHEITGCGLNNALESLPHLETLELSYICVSAKDIEAIGRNCPHLKSFKIWVRYLSSHGNVRAIANGMPALRHLELIGTLGGNDALRDLELIGTIRGDNDGVRAILNGCPHLESLHILNLYNPRLDPDLEKLCRERIKDFQFNWEHPRN